MPQRQKEINQLKGEPTDDVEEDDEDDETPMQQEQAPKSQLKQQGVKGDADSSSDEDSEKEQDK